MQLFCYGVRLQIPSCLKLADFNSIILNLFQLKLSGRSGCRLEVLDDGNSIVVKKFPKDSAYLPRLIKQAIKQAEFESRVDIKAPAVKEMVDQAEGYFVMEYVPGEKYSEYLCRVSLSEVNRVLDSLILFIRQGLNSAEYVKPDFAIFQDKIEQLQALLDTSNEVVNTHLNALRNNMPVSDLPLGYCHGDLTFSNMVFTRQSIYLVDFLDSFVESPIVDLVKLKQDTQFLWTLKIDSDIPAHSRNKAMQIMAHFDRRLDQLLVEYNHFNGWFNYLNSFNYLRILPYVTDSGERDLVLNALRKIHI